MANGSTLMLTQLLQLLQHHRGGLSLDAISRQLDAPPSAVAGMIDQLVRKGRLIEIGPDGGACNVCPLLDGCGLIAGAGKRYVVATERASTPTDPAESGRGIWNPRRGS